MEPIAIGQVVKSTAGRDAGRYFVVLAQEDADYVCIADGVLRHIATPKRKKVKHLTLEPHCIDHIADKIASGVRIFDAELRNALEALHYTVRRPVVNPENDYPSTNVDTIDVTNK